MRLFGPALLPIVLTMLTGCTEKDLGYATIPESAARTTSRAEATAAAGELGRAFALAMSRQEVRVQLRNAMRASPLTEHKLVLQDFIRTPAGQTLVRAAANAAGKAPHEIDALVSSLPLMDFYVPLREHRMQWRGNADIVVAVALGNDWSAASFYGTDGRLVHLAGSSPPPAGALLMIHPAERKSRRIHPQRNAVGDVIQDPDDGELSGTFAWTDRQGRSREVDLADLVAGRRAGVQYMEPCSECTGGGGGAGASDTTFLDYLWVNYEDGLYDAVEVELLTRYVVGDQEVDYGTLRIEGVVRYTHYYPHSMLILREIPPGSTDKITLKVYETDALFNDYFGKRDFVFGDKAIQRTIWSDQKSCEPFAGSTETVTCETGVELDWY